MLIVQSRAFPQLVISMSPWIPHY